MTQNDNIKQNEELKEELEKDLWLDSNDNDNEFIENDDNIDSELDQNQNDEISKLKELLARTQADYNNFKMRSERDRQDMIFFLKNDICFQHNQTYPVEMFDKKYEELKKEFGEPVKGTDRFSFKDGLVQLTYVNKEDAEKITENKLVFDGTGAKESFTVLWGCIE